MAQENLTGSDVLPNFESLNHKLKVEEFWEIVFKTFMLSQGSEPLQTQLFGLLKIIFPKLQSPYKSETVGMSRYRALPKAIRERFERRATSHKTTSQTVPQPNDSTIGMTFARMADRFHSELRRGPLWEGNLAQECGIAMLGLDYYYVLGKDRRAMSYFQSYVVNRGSIEPHLKVMLDKVREECIKGNEVHPIRDSKVRLYSRNPTDDIRTPGEKVLQVEVAWKRVCEQLPKNLALQRDKIALSRQ